MDQHLEILKRFRNGLLLAAGLCTASAAVASDHTVDFCVYGGTSGGVIAAVQAARLGLTVALVEAGGHLGGMTAGGLSWTDVGRSGQVQAIGGLAREFYVRVGARYGLASDGPFAAPLVDNDRRSNDWKKPPSIAFEPKVAESVFEELARTPGISVYRHEHLRSARRSGSRLQELTTAEGDRFRAKVFLDATYEGDLIAQAGVTFALGREANAQYGETHNGSQPPGKGGFEEAVDPYLVPGHPESGPLPYLLTDEPWGPVGVADRRIQSYNYRVCLTDDPGNRRPIEPPPGYDPANFELLARWTEARVAAGEKLTLKSYCKYDPLPHHKFDFNNRWPISTDFIGHADGYVEASRAGREKIAREHEYYLRGFFHFLATSPRVPASVRDDMARFGLPRDEFIDSAGWPQQLYVREGRRLVGEFVMTENNESGLHPVPDSIGLGVYGMDSHALRRVVYRGQPMNEVQVGAPIPHPYPISYRSIVPQRSQCENLFATFALSASHVAFASIRMEPVFMELSQAAGVAAWMALRDGVAVQAVSYAQLRRRLLANHAVLDWPSPQPSS